MEPSSRVSAIQPKRSNSTNLSTSSFTHSTLTNSALTNLVGTSIALLTLAFPLWAVAYFSSGPSNPQPNWQPTSLSPAIPLER